MPLFRVTFTESGGYRISVRLRAGTTAPLVTLAVKQVWGEEARWDRTIGEARQGRVCREGDMRRCVPLTGLVTVTVERVARRRRELTCGTGAE
jgi:hypothetical protein